MEARTALVFQGRCCQVNNCNMAASGIAYSRIRAQPTLTGSAAGSPQSSEEIDMSKFAPAKKNAAAPAPAPAPTKKGRAAQEEPEAAPAAAPAKKGRTTNAAAPDPKPQVAKDTSTRPAAGTGVDLDESLIPATDLYDRKVVAAPACSEARPGTIDSIYARLAKKPITLRALIIAVDQDEEYRSRRRSSNPANLITRVRDAYSTFEMLVDA